MICFIVNVYEEPEEEVEALLNCLRAHYPLAKIVLFEDGGHEYPQDWGDFHRRFEHRKTPLWGGFWTHRYLDQALRAYPAEHYIKVDPDTSIVKAAQSLPDGEAIFSAVYTHDLGDRKYRIPHGGALGFTRAAARRIVDDRLMLRATFCHPVFGRYGAYNDLMLADAILIHDLNLEERTDFACGKSKSMGPDTTFAHLH
jgi:hypothetical protein